MRNARRAELQSISPPADLVNQLSSHTFLPMNKLRAGIVGVSGYGGGEALRLLANHPYFDLVHVAGEEADLGDLEQVTLGTRRGGAP